MPIAGESLVCIPRIVNDAGEPRCEGCRLIASPDGGYCDDCSFVGDGIDIESVPGPTCPVWHGENVQ
jgi:hypothetical protein